MIAPDPVESLLREARALFESGCEVVYVTLTHDGRFELHRNQPSRAVVVAARSEDEIRRFVGAMTDDLS